HLTLARIRKGRKLTETIHKRLQIFATQEFGAATFNRVVLFSSKLTPQGPVYTELQEINLA
ncbi:MAG: RNA 2',3'-cyclic phosphodiesterase, partial [Spirochaetota bacterium]